MGADEKPHNEVNEALRRGSIKKKVFSLLDKNPLLTARMICQLLNLDYIYYRNYIYDLRYKWKISSQIERGSKPSIHHWRGWAYLPRRHVGDAEQRDWVRAFMRLALKAGWLETRARNRWILWKDRFGRLQLFETGRINLYIRRPATLGKAYQLMCNALALTGLITDLKVLEPILRGIRFKAAHYVYDTKHALPKLTIDLFAKSNGIVIKVGDRTHPTSVEVIASYPDWAERNERVLGDFIEVMTNFIRAVSPETALKKPERMDYIT